MQRYRHHLTKLANQLKDGPQVGRILHAKPARHKFEREQEQNSHNWDKSCTHTCHFHKPFLGISRLSPYKLRGPTSLNALDLTNVLVFPDDAEDAANEDDPAPPLLGENATQSLPLADLKFLNLTGALLNMDSPMEHLAFDLMPSLQVSHQTITMWNFTIMRENSTDRKSRLSWAKNGKREFSHFIVKNSHNSRKG